MEDDGIKRGIEVVTAQLIMFAYLAILLWYLIRIVWL